MLRGLQEGSKEGQLVLGDGNEENVGQGDHLVGMLGAISVEVDGRRTCP